MTCVAFIVHGTPIPKLRARHRTVKPKVGKEFVTSYTPGKTVEYERAVAWACKAAMRARPPMEGAITLELKIYVPIPASWSNKKKVLAIAGKVHATSRPDAGNVQKSVEDALNKIAYVDDAQIVCLTVIKRYSHQPRVEVCVGQVPE